MTTTPVHPVRPATPVPLVLAGAHGHGRWHLTNIRRLQDEGLVRLAGVLDPVPPTGEELAELGFTVGELELSSDLDPLLGATGARIAVISTPIHTHTDLALTAARRGVHLLLEKPPAPSWAEFRRMADGVAEAGVACQIGFQSLGSHALPAVAELIAEGAVGTVTGVGGAGTWVRDEAYYRRAPWAGRRRLDGRDVVDGVLTNPLAHAVATALAVAGTPDAGDVMGVETELFHAHDIEADDTSCVRITTPRGRVAVAATLCAGEDTDPYVVVHGSRGRITLWYTRDRVAVRRAGREPEETVYGRTDLLENLVRHLTEGAELLVPPEATGAFMRVVEAIRRSPDPAALPPAVWRPEEGGRRVVAGVEEAVTTAAESLALFSESGVPWAP